MNWLRMRSRPVAMLALLVAAPALMAAACNVTTTTAPSPSPAPTQTTASPPTPSSFCTGAYDVGQNLIGMTDGAIDNQPQVMSDISQDLKSMTAGNAQQSAELSSLQQDVSAIYSSDELGDPLSQGIITQETSYMYTTVESIENACSGS
jgi:hypothetical protein